MRSWAAVPAADLAFLRSLRPSFAIGGYFFAHAGVRPDMPLERQDVMDLAWIREPSSPGAGGLSGGGGAWPHARPEGPEVLPHRIGIDTGGRSTAAALTCAGAGGRDRSASLFA
jgi:serine/threonine protein phosphatase 1